MPENNPGGYINFRDMFDGGGRGRSGDRFEGGGLLSVIGNALGGPGMFGGRGQAAPIESAMPMARPAFAPAMAAPASSQMPMQRPFAPTDAAIPPAMDAPIDSLPNMMDLMADMPPAVQRFLMQYGQAPDQMMAAFPQSPNMSVAPRAPAYNPPPITFDRATGMPIAMMPPRVQ